MEWVPREVREISRYADGRLEFACPQCGGLVDMMPNEINCGIFRHGFLRHNRAERLPPHASQAECEALIFPNSGCSRPFCFNGRLAAPCDYNLPRFS